jgi:hypothetical protein
MEERVNPGVESEKAKRHVYGERHACLNWTDTSLAAGSMKIRAKVVRSPEDFSILASA